MTGCLFTRDSLSPAAAAFYLAVRLGTFSQRVRDRKCTSNILLSCVTTNSTPQS